MQLLTGAPEGGAPGGENDPASLDSKGCTANVCLIRDKILYCGNAGDSRCILSVRGVAFDLSEDHKPENEIERKRIYAAGSEITEGRVDGNLNLSRSIGDLKYKKNKTLKPEEHPITCVPDTKKRELNSDVDFMVLACDGIWEQRTSQDVVDYVAKGMKDKKSLTDIVNSLLDDILSPDYTETQGLGCDNMTCIIVKFNHDEE